MLNLIVNIKFSMQKGYINILGAELILWIIKINWRYFMLR